MNKTEYTKCVKLMDEAINKAKSSKEAFNNAYNMDLSDTQRKIEELKGQNYAGYAEGINKVLAVLGFEHEQMKKLQELLYSIV